MTKTFAELGLNEQILDGVMELGFTDPTPVQEQAIPEALKGRDVVASAQTGTGKTAAFTLPTLQRIATFPVPRGPKGPSALVVTPTRELAQQIDKVATTISKRTGQKIVIVTGGTKYEKQVEDIKNGCDLLVATPGRLIDLMERKLVYLGNAKVVTLDEADRMLDMGFWPDVKRILAKLPKERQTLLFSATLSGAVKRTVDTMLHDPAIIEIARTGSTADTVKQVIMPVTQGQKSDVVSQLLDRNKPERVLIFCRTKQRVDSLAERLTREGRSVGVMHADRQQRQREAALSDFRSGKLQVLVATDVMSRGIDVDGIDCVINFDVPLDSEDYVHRIGRTGRAGHEGESFTLVGPDEITPFREIEYFTKQVIETYDLPDYTYAPGRIIPNATRKATKGGGAAFKGRRGGRPGQRFGRHT